jgi:hypothetical protein
VSCDGNQKLRNKGSKFERDVRLLGGYNWCRAGDRQCGELPVNRGSCVSADSFGIDSASGEVVIKVIKMLQVLWTAFYFEPRFR